MGHFRVRAITPNRASAIMEWRQAMVGSSVHRFPLSVLREGVGVRALIVPTSSAPGNLMVLFGFYCSRKLDDRADDARVAVNRQTMLRSPIVRLVDFCARFPWPVIVCVLGLTALSGDYAARHFAIKTDINNLFPPTLPWTQRAASYMKAFPQRDILVVVDALNGRPAHFSWRALADGKSPDPSELRRFIAIAPVLDFKALEPGRAAVDAINRAAQRLDLAGEYQARVRQTGLVPIDDDQFATLTDHAVLNLTVAIGAVVIILWLALRSSGRVR